jgi:peptidoglycan hydrolase-like protein with peptidoglycan-binding domain
MNEINSPDCDPHINLGQAVQTDGDFGPLTLAATRAFQLGASNQTAFSQSMLTEIQQKNGGPINLVATDESADGIVGPLTHKAMDVLLSVQVC